MRVVLFFYLLFQIVSLQAGDTVYFNEKYYWKLGQINDSIQSDTSNFLQLTYMDGRPSFQINLSQYNWNHSGVWLLKDSALTLVFDKNQEGESYLTLVNTENLSVLHWDENMLQLQKGDDVLTFYSPKQEEENKRWQFWLIAGIILAAILAFLKLRKRKN